MLEALQAPCYLYITGALCKQNTKIMRVKRRRKEGCTLCKFTEKPSEWFAWSNVETGIVIGTETLSWLFSVCLCLVYHCTRQKDVKLFSEVRIFLLCAEDQFTAVWSRHKVSVENWRETCDLYSALRKYRQGHAWQYWAYWKDSINALEKWVKSEFVILICQSIVSPKRNKQTNSLAFCFQI